MRHPARLGLAVSGLVLLMAVAALTLLGDEPDPDSPPDPQSAFSSSFYAATLADDAPVDPGSEAAVGQLANLASGLAPEADDDCRAVLETPEAERSRCTPVTFSASIEHGPFAPPIWIADADEPLVEVALDNADPSLDAVMRDEGVPIPADAEPADGSDGQLVVYQPSTDTMWELWQAARAPGGGWRAAYGGRIQDVAASPGHFADVVDAKAPGGFSERHEWGETATSLPNMPGVIGADELREGTIDHALNIAIFNPTPGEWVYPAQRGDGRCVSGSCSAIPQGARFRLDPDFEISTIEHPVVRMIAAAAQDHGLVVNNTADAGVTFYTEGWQPYGENVFEGETDLLQTDDGSGYTNQYMTEFPWERLQMLRLGTRCTDTAVQCEQPSWWEGQFDAG